MYLSGSCNLIILTIIWPRNLGYFSENFEAAVHREDVKEWDVGFQHAIARGMPHFLHPEIERAEDFFQRIGY